MTGRSFHLLFCMTPGVGLATWRADGVLDREMMPYVEYARRGWRVTIATYDRPDMIPPLPPGIDAVFCPHPRLLFLLPWTLRRAVLRADVVKTNQSQGAWWYLAAARLGRKPFILRCGWLPGPFLEKLEGMSWRLRRHRWLEGWAFRHADACQVATAEDRDWAVAHYGVPAGTIHVRPNFVNIAAFRPLGLRPKPRSVVFVGRLAPQKNLDLLIRSCEEAGASKLTLIGEGPERERLERMARTAKLSVECLGSRPHEDLPRLLQSAEVFALPSKVEGHPKALLEAMACGMACVATRVPGNISAVEDGVTGLMCDENAASVAAALKRLLDDPGLRRRLGENARRQVEEHLDFARIFGDELRLVEQLASSTHG